MKNLKLFLIAILSLAYISAFAQQNEIIVLAHRGGCGEGMENVESSFKRSLEAGIKAFEIDVRITKDGKLVMQHDNTLKRTSGIDKAVEDMTEKELREVRLNDGSKLMFLDEFLKLMSDQTGLFVEIELKSSKYSEEFLANSGYCDKVAKAVLKAQPEGSTYVMTSFDARALRYIRTKYPNADLGYITSEGCTPEVIKLAKAIGVKRLATNINRTSREGINLAHKNGMTVNLWPGREDYSIVRAWALGADIHCTDYPIKISNLAHENYKWITVK